MVFVENFSNKGKLKEEYIRSVIFYELKQMKIIRGRMNLEVYLHRKYTRWKGHFERNKTLEEVCDREINDNTGKIIMQAERKKIEKCSTGETYRNFGRIIVGKTF